MEIDERMKQHVEKQAQCSHSSYLQTLKYNLKTFQEHLDFRDESSCDLCH